MGDMGETAAMVLDWANWEREDLRFFNFDFNKFFDRIAMEFYEALTRRMGLTEAMIRGSMNYLRSSQVYLVTFLGVLDPIERRLSTPQGAVPSSDVAKVIGMVLQKGIMALEEEVHISDVVGVAVIGGDDLEVQVEGLGGGVDVSLLLYCDDGSNVRRGDQKAVQSGLDDFGILMCACRLAFKGKSVSVRGPFCLREETYVVFGVGLQGEVESVVVRTMWEDARGERLLGTDIKAGRLWGGGGGGTRYRNVGAMAGWIRGGGFSVGETRQLVKSIIVPRATFGVAMAGVSPKALKQSDRALSAVSSVMGLDITCARAVAFARGEAGGMGISALTAETVAAGARDLNVVLGGRDVAGGELSLREKMWRYTMTWASYQHVGGEDSMVVALLELLAVYGLQVRESRGASMQMAENGYITGYWKKAGHGIVSA